MISQQFLQLILASFIVAFISFVGFGAVAEKVYAVLVAIFGRASYRQYTEDWKALKKAKQELQSISAQDEFAKWARLQRKIDTMQASFDSLHSSRKRSAMAGEFALSVALRVVMYAALFWWGFVKGCSKAVAGVNLEVLGPIGRYLAFPYLKEGEVSVCAMLVLGILSFKHLIAAFKPSPVQTTQ